MRSQRFGSSEHLVYRIAYCSELLLRQAETRREIETLSCDPFCHWIMFMMKEPLFTKNWLFVHAKKERASFNPALFEPKSKTNRIHPCIFGKNHTVHPIHTFGPGFLVRKLQSWDTVQSAVIFVTHPALARNDLRDALQLCHTQGRLHIGQAKIKSQSFMIETSLRLKTQISQRSRLLCECLIISEHHPSLAGGDELVGIEAETTQ